MNSGDRFRRLHHHKSENSTQDAGERKVVTRRGHEKKALKESDRKKSSLSNVWLGAESSANTNSDRDNVWFLK